MPAKGQRLSEEEKARLRALRGPHPCRDPVERFWSHVVKTSGCWLWTASLDGVGYGKFGLTPKNIVGAHRYAYELEYGSIPSGLQVCHLCDITYPKGDITYRRCVRPDHLWLGTPKDNLRDAMEKGRVCNGEDCPWAILKEADIPIIRALLDMGFTYSEIGREFAVTPGTIKFIDCRETWKHIP